MNDKDIIKALECCSKQTMISECEKCPIVSPNGCRTELIGYALALIKRQQAEIEKLTIQKNAFGAGMKVEARKHQEVRNEAIKEFAERLKKEACYFCRAVAVEDIDNLVKEMLGEEDE